MTTTFNSKDFIKTFKEGYEAIPNHQGNQAAKVLVADAIKAHKFHPEDVLYYICDKMGINLYGELSNEEWKAIFNLAIKRNDLVGKCLEVCTTVEKGSKKVSYKDLFSTVVSRCGGIPNLLLQELYLNKVGWNKVADTLVKTEVETETTKSEVAKTEKVVVKKEEKSSIKTTNDPHKLLEELTTRVFPSLHLAGKRPRLTAHPRHKKVYQTLIRCSIEVVDVITPPIFSDRIVGEVGLLCRLINVTGEDDVVLDTKLLKSHFRGTNPRESSSNADRVLGVAEGSISGSPRGLRRFAPLVFFRIFAVPTNSLGGGMVDTRDLDTIECTL